ncbi:MAG: flagellin [Arcobacteraceae bacterium]|nr:flagellin [Arcobacteraceae bacterium]
MDINTNNNLNSISNTQNSALERISTGLAINKASDDSSSLSIAAALGSQRSTMYQALENINSGIAMSNIAQGGLREQSNILNEINTLSLQAMNGTTSAEGKEAIKGQISSYLDQFDAIAQSTNYNGEQLLAGNQQDLSIVTGDDSIINMQSEETADISQNIRSFLDDFTVNPNAMSNLFDATKAGMGKLSEFSSNFSASSNQMESSGRTAIASQTSLAQASSNIMEVDYSREVTDFSKNNLMAQIGLLASTQANAVQQRSVSLLS